MRPTVVSFRHISTFGTVYTERVSVRSHLCKTVLCCTAASFARCAYARLVLRSCIHAAWSTVSCGCRHGFSPNARIASATSSSIMAPVAWFGTLTVQGVFLGLLRRSVPGLIFAALVAVRKYTKTIHACSRPSQQKFPPGGKKPSEKWTNCTFTSFC